MANIETELKITKSIKATRAFFEKLDRERKKIKPAPSLHAYMLFKLSK